MLIVNVDFVLLLRFLRFFLEFGVFRYFGGKCGLFYVMVDFIFRMGSEKYRAEEVGWLIFFYKGIYGVIEVV